MILPAFIGEAVHHLRDGSVRRFRPTGPLLTYRAPPRGASEDIEHFGKGGTQAARIIVGLNVGTTPTYTPEYVIDLVYKIRKAQSASGDVSVLAQLGIYEDSEGRRIDEQSVQIVILDLGGEKNFKQAMLDLGEELRIRMKQERVIIEMQKGGVVQDVYSATDPKLLKKASE